MKTVAGNSVESSIPSLSALIAWNRSHHALFKENKMNIAATKNADLQEFCSEHGLRMRTYTERNIKFLAITTQYRPKKKHLWSKKRSEQEVVIGTIQGLGFLNIVSREVITRYKYVPFKETNLYIYGVPMWPNGLCRYGNPYSELFDEFCERFTKTGLTNSDL